MALHLDKSKALWKRMGDVVPGGGSTFSKRVTSFHDPSVFPAFAQRGDGAYLYDVDGNRYLDFIAALAPVLLGYNDKRVNGAIQRQLEKGCLFSLPIEDELRLAETLVEILPGADMVRFFKTGAEATTAAVRASRLITGRECVVSCGYHGWHDWWAVLKSQEGIPVAQRSLTYSFAFNDLAAAEAILSERGNAVACIIVTPALYGLKPSPGFLEGLRQLADLHGCLLVFDEIITGFRFSLGGAQECYGGKPDISVFAKAIANGMPLAALTGHRTVMESLCNSWVSSTYAGETLSIAAALETIDILREGSVYDHLKIISSQLHVGVKDVGRSCGISINANDRLNAMRFDFCLDKEPAKALLDGFIAECARLGVLIRREGESGFSLCLIAAATQSDIDFALQVFETALKHAIMSAGL